jgi:hypothetical protein
MSAENLCLRCGRPTPDGFADVHCRDRAAAQLVEIADMVPAARDIAHGLSSTLSGSGGSGKPGSRLPLDLGATARCDSVANVLTTWTRHVAEERGLRTPQPGAYSVYAASDDPLEFAALWLGEHLEWLRHRPECDEFLADVEAAVRVMRGIVRGPAAQRYLGPCGAPQIAIDPDVAAEHGIHPANAALGLAPCDGDVYARDNAATGRCRTCGAEVSTAERQAWLDSEVRSRAFRAAEIASAYRINVKTIRSWATERQARYDHSGTQVQAPRPAKLHAHGWDRDGRPLFLVGEVLDLAAVDAARREEARAERARRKTQTEGAAA